MAAIEAAQQSQKPQKTSSYACHICGLNGHKITYYHKFTKMKRMFHGKSMTVAEIQHVVKIKSLSTIGFEPKTFF